jgi:hypothetical protein
MKKLIVLFIVSVVCGRMAFAQDPAVIASNKPGWHKIGEVKADFKTENESIIVMGKDKFKSVKLKVTDAPIDISNVIIYYEGDGMQEIPATGMLSAGAETKTYELDYPDKEIKKVSFTYKSEPNYKGNKAHVELYGLK